MGVAIADYDDDGRMDVFVANDKTPNFLYHNEGRGQFKEAALEAGFADRALSFLGDDWIPVALAVCAILGGAVLLRRFLR